MMIQAIVGAWSTLRPKKLGLGAFNRRDYWKIDSGTQKT